jgi:hypothetical protein
VPPPGTPFLSAGKVTKNAFLVQCCWFGSGIRRLSDPRIRIL